MVFFGQDTALLLLPLQQEQGTLLLFSFLYFLFFLLWLDNRQKYRNPTF